MVLLVPLLHWISDCFNLSGAGLLRLPGKEAVRLSVCFVWWHVLMLLVNWICSHTWLPAELLLHQKVDSDCIRTKFEVIFFYFRNDQNWCTSCRSCPAYAASVTKDSDSMWHLKEYTVLLLTAVLVNVLAQSWYIFRPLQLNAPILLHYHFWLSCLSFLVYGGLRWKW